MSGCIAQLDRSFGGDKGLYENVPRHTTSPAPGGGGFQILPLDHDESLHYIAILEGKRNQRIKSL